MAGTSPISGAFAATHRAISATMLARVRTLVAQGASSLRNEIQPIDDEPAITSRLVLKMEAALAASEDWDNFAVVDNARAATPSRLGKHAPQVDITVTFNAHPRWKFCIEAKIVEDPRKRHQRAEADYIGKEGIEGGFVEEYYTNSDVAAMLAYVRSHTVSEWWARLYQEIDAHGARLNLLEIENISMDPAMFADEWRSKHTKRSTGTITLFHILLDCRAPESTSP